MESTKDHLGHPQLVSSAGFIYPMPTGDTSIDNGRINDSMFGYKSNHVHAALIRDDADAFARFLKECGGTKIMVLGYSTVHEYVKAKGGEKCMTALKKMRD